LSELPRPNHELVDAIDELRRQVQALRDAPVSVGPWRLGANDAGQLTATHRTSGEVRVLALP
jgi:hypothetical protein